MLALADPVWLGLQTLLVCPLCKGELEFLSDSIRCLSCREAFPQTVDGPIDLTPREVFRAERSRWSLRQSRMENWYGHLISDPNEAAYCFNHDYTPYAPRLASLSGIVLDVGGGNGIPREFLSEDVAYVVIDPSLDWLDSKWKAIVDKFPCLKEQPNFVRGLGEYLPFPDRSIDHVLSFWSLNHAVSPEQIFGEIYRVLRPDGRFLAALEDMKPRWSELRLIWTQVKEKKRRHALLRSKLAHTLAGSEWPVQDDHIPIRESDMKKWSAGRFTVIERSWISECLTYEFRRD